MKYTLDPKHQAIMALCGVDSEDGAPIEVTQSSLKSMHDAAWQLSQIGLVERCKTGWVLTELGQPAAKAIIANGVRTTSIVIDINT